MRLTPIGPVCVPEPPPPLLRLENICQTFLSFFEVCICPIVDFMLQFTFLEISGGKNDINLDYEKKPVENILIAEKKSINTK